MYKTEINIDYYEDKILFKIFKMHIMVKFRILKVLITINNMQ